MGPVAAILRSLANATRRDLGTFRSIQVNNFFLFVFLLIYGALVSGVRPVSSYPFLLLLGLLLLFPLSSDPLARIPASRLGFWPLGARQRYALRLVSLALSPVLWFALFLAMRTRPSLTLVFAGLASIGQAAVRAGPQSRSGARIFPAMFPPLFRNNLRQMLSILDTWVAILLSVAGTAWRLVATHPDPAAFPIFAMLVALALSTYTQCLFALDGSGGVTRYRLLPMRDWQILGAKDAACLALLCVLVAPLSLPSGLAFGLTALAIGHYPSMRHRLPLHRRRFAGGRVVYGVAQIVAGAMLGFAAYRQSWLYLLPAAALYGISLYRCRNMRKL